TYTHSLHDALPISRGRTDGHVDLQIAQRVPRGAKTGIHFPSEGIDADEQNEGNDEEKREREESDEDGEAGKSPPDTVARGPFPFCVPRHGERMRAPLGF